MALEGRVRSGYLWRPGRRRPRPRAGPNFRGTRPRPSAVLNSNRGLASQLRVACSTSRVWCKPRSTDYRGKDYRRTAGTRGRGRRPLIRLPRAALCANHGADLNRQRPWASVQRPSRSRAVFRYSGDLISPQKHHDQDYGDQAGHEAEGKSHPKRSPERGVAFLHRNGPSEQYSGDASASVVRVVTRMNHVDEIAASPAAIRLPDSSSRHASSSAMAAR